MSENTYVIPDGQDISGILANPDSPLCDVVLNHLKIAGITRVDDVLNVSMVHGKGLVYIDDRGMTPTKDASYELFLPLNRGNNANNYSAFEENFENLIATFQQWKDDNASISMFSEPGKWSVVKVGDEILPVPRSNSRNGN